MKKAIIIAVIVVAVVVGAYFLFFNDDSDSDDDTASEQSTAQTETSTEPEETEKESDDEETAEVAATITYSDSGFSVDTETVPAGSTIEIVNNSGATLDFASNEHPVHSDNSEFNVGLIEAGESTTFVVEQTGTWGFHDHLNSSQTGEITVE